MAATSSRRTFPRATAAQTVGYAVLMIIAWLAAEYWRPPNPLKVPFMLSFALAAGWLLRKPKRWNRQIVLMLLFVGQMAFMSPFSENNFTALMTTREAFTVIVCIAIPMAHFIDTLQRFQTVVRAWIFIFVFMAVVAVLNGGVGPGGAAGGVDENYTALFMTIALSLTYFMMQATPQRGLKLALLAAMALFVVAIVAGLSRGGFVGLMSVGIFCWWRSPRKLPSLVVAVTIALVVLAFAPATYWEEIRTIANTTESTAGLRLTFWKIAWSMYLDNPIFGVGPGNFRWVSGLYQSLDSEGTALGMNVTHSLYFELLSEMGTTGVILFGSIVYFNARDLRLVARIARREQQRTRRNRSVKPSPRERKHLDRLKGAGALASGLAAAFVGFFVCSAFLSTLYYTTFWLLTAMTVALREAVLTETRALRAAQMHRSLNLSPRSDVKTPPASSGRLKPGQVGR